jgi:hypothetical protein
MMPLIIWLYLTVSVEIYLCGYDSNISITIKYLNNVLSNTLDYLANLRKSILKIANMFIVKKLKANQLHGAGFVLRSR